MFEIISLVENTTSSSEYICEHGLALYLKFNDKSYLIDTGASNNFIKNVFVK